MGKLIFRHGVMEAGKSAELIMKAFTFREKGKKVAILKPSLDTRSPKGAVKSRIGIEAACLNLGIEDRVYDVLTANGMPDIILIDEAQFMQPAHVEELASIIDDFDVLCIAYGLLVGSDTHLFPGSQRLVELADRIDESPSMCACGRKATMHYRKIESKEQILCGGSELYLSVCRRCYNNLKASNGNNKRK